MDVACVRASEVCWFGFEGGLMGAAWVLEGEGCMCDYVVLPLLNSGGLGRLLRGLWMWI